MINFLMFSASYLLFICLPACIILTIFFAVKKNKKSWIPAIGIPVCFVVSIVFFIIGGTMYGKTDEYKKYMEEQEIINEQKQKEKEEELIQESIEEEESKKASIEVEESRQASIEAEEQARKESEETKRKEEEERQKEAEEQKKREEEQKAIEESKQKEEAEKEQQISEENFKKSCQEFDYNTVARNPDQHIGENFYVTVRISQSISETSWFADYDKYYMAYTDDGSGFYLDKMMWLMDYQKDDSRINILEGDIVKVYGTFNGMGQTINHLNDTKSEDVKLDIYYVELISE